MIKLCLLPQVHSVEFEKISFDTVDPLRDGGISMIIEWPTLPNNGDYFELSDWVFGRVISCSHRRDSNKNPQCDVICFVDLSEYEELAKSEGWRVH